MLDNISSLIQFSGPKRFLTSIGIVLVALSIVLPLLTISQPVTVVDMKTTEFNELTQLAQYNILARQSISLAVLLLSCCLSPILCVLGVSFSTVSFWAWLLFGDAQDDKKTPKSEKVIEKHSPRNNTESESHNLLSMPEAQMPNGIAVSTDVPKTQIASREIVQANEQDNSLQRIKRILSSTNTWGNQYTVESDDEFDILLSSKSENSDILIDFLFISPKDFKRISSFYISLIKKWVKYRVGKHKKAKVIGVVLQAKSFTASEFLILILNKNPLSFLFRLDVSLFSVSFSDINEKSLLSMLHNDFPSLFQSHNQ